MSGQASSQAPTPPTPQQLRQIINHKIMGVEAEIPSVHTVKDHIVEGGQYQTPVRIYHPNTDKGLPLVLMIHGGAWVAGDIETHDNMARYICKRSGSIVVSVDYDLAPEAKFPVALEQCYEVLQWLEDSAASLGADFSTLAFVGDSAGGNIGAGLCLFTRDRKGPAISKQILVNPSTDLSCGGTLEMQGDALDNTRWVAKLYLNTPEDVKLPYVSPVFAEDLSGLPSTLVVVAENDLLRAEGEKYGELLKTAGTPCEIYCHKGVGHLAGDGARASKLAQESLDVVCEFLKS